MVFDVMNKLKSFNNNKGAVLVTGLMFLTILTLIGTTAYLTTSNELKTSRNYRISKQALYDAEAGIEFALARLEGYLEAGTPVLPAAGSTMGWPSGDNTPPTGFNFILSTIAGTSISTGDNTWILNSTGYGSNNESSAQVEVMFQRTFEPWMNFAAFGENEVVEKNGAFVYSYSSSSTGIPNCTAATSTGAGDIGSNGTVDINAGTTLDGDAYGGEAANGTNATISNGPGATEHDVDRINPDPLSLNVSGSTYNPASYAVINDNVWDNGWFVVGTTIGSGTTTLCGKPGGANYYVTSFDIGNGDTLNIDTDNSTAACLGKGAGGPINIFHDSTSKLDIKVNSTVNIDCDPTEFAIYSNTSANVNIKHGQDFTGLIYAPNANIDVKNSGNVKGALWGLSVDTKNNGTICFDTDLASKYTGVVSNDLALYIWRNIRN